MSQGDLAGFRRAADVPEELHGDVASLLLSLADNKRLLGMRYSEWLLGAPTLDAELHAGPGRRRPWHPAHPMRQA